MRWPVHKNEGRCPSKDDPDARDFTCRGCTFMDLVAELVDHIEQTIDVVDVVAKGDAKRSTEAFLRAIRTKS